MDLDRAMHAHLRYRPKMQLAIDSQQKINAAEMSADGCEFGQWLSTQTGSAPDALSPLNELVGAHDAFHAEVDTVAGAINAGEYAEAARMLGLGTPFSKQSLRLCNAIGACKEGAPVPAPRPKTAGVR